MDHDPIGAFLVLLAFDAFLRTGEIYDLQTQDLQYDASSLVVRLLRTKSGQRHGAFEALTVHDPLVLRMWRRLRRTHPDLGAPGCYVYPAKTSEFAARFAAALAHFNLSRLQLRVYSLRRGGATAFYKRTGSMDQTLERGRWATRPVGRIYINDGLGKMVEQLITSHDHSLLSSGIAQLRAFLAAEMGC
jgi:integrase